MVNLKKNTGEVKECVPFSGTEAFFESPRPRRGAADRYRPVTPPLRSNHTTSRLKRS